MAALGARKLGYNITVVPRQARVSFHSHHANEEMFFVSMARECCASARRVSGAQGISSPAPRRPDVAHQFINTDAICATSR